MPCVYTETPQERAASKQERKMKLKDELDKVTRLLCLVKSQVEIFEDSESVKVLPDNKELEDWYFDYKNRDAKNQQEKLQKLKESAKKKLTKEELKALGIE